MMNIPRFIRRIPGTFLRFAVTLSYVFPFSTRLSPSLASDGVLKHTRSIPTSYGSESSCYTNLSPTDALKLPPV